MKAMLIGVLLGFVIAVVISILFWMFRRKRGNRRGKMQIYTSIEELRSVGELVVFKVVTQQIVTAAKHWFSEWGKKYLQWLVSTKKMAMIFEFEIDFRYDLRSSDFNIQDEGNNYYRLKMPKCFYEVHFRNIKIYDEQSPELLPGLLPGMLSRIFGPGFDESDKNCLIEEAKHQAAQMAKDFVQKMESGVQTSATQTLETLAKAFGAKGITIDFSDSELIQVKVDSVA
jgi:hypothetical protein